MWQVVTESKNQLVSCELSLKSLQRLSTFEDIFAIDSYIFCDSFCYVLLSDVLSIFVNMCARVLVFCSSELSFTNFPGSDNLRSSDPQIHICSTYFDFDCYVQYFFKVEFLISIFISLLLKTFFSWVWYFTMTALLMRFFFSICSSYWMLQIKIINL